METIYMAVVGAALSLLGVLLFGGVALRSFRRLTKHGLAFCLICFGFLVSMATKPGPTTSHTVKFSVGEYGQRTGGGALEQTVDDGKDAEAPVISPKAGYEHAGWDKDFTNVKTDLDVNAIYTNTIYSIAYENTMGAVHSNPSTFTVSNEFTFAAPSAVAGYEFAGWTPTGIEKGTTSNVTVTAAWNELPPPKNTNTVTFVLGEYGTHVGGGALEQKVEEGGDAEAPEVEAKAGWEFTGWDKPFTEVMEDLTVNALYTNTIYTITYENTMGASNPNPTGFTVTNEIEFAALDSVEGYDFAGWTPSGIEKGTTSNVTAVAAWTKWPVPTNTVTFVLGEYGERTGGGELVQYVEEGQDAEAPIVKATNGYEFASWDKPFTEVTEDLTVNALYTNTIYAITYENTKGVENPNPTEFTIEDAIEFAALGSVEGFTFVGWTPSGIAKGTTSNVTATANWTKILPPTQTNTVTFVLGEYGERTGGGELVQYVEEGQDAEAPIVKATNGYEFASWDKPFTEVTEDLTVNALYTNTIYAITYENTKGVENPNPTEFTVTNEIVFAALNNVRGYEFIEWTPSEITKGTTSNVLVTAVWRELPPPAETNTVTFMLGEYGERIGGGELTQRVAEGYDAVAPIVKANAGYEFAGWDKAFTEVTEDLEVNALYTNTIYAITYEDTMGAENLNPTVFTVTNEFEFVELGAISGYEFVGWSPTGIVKGTTSNVTATASWKKLEPPYEVAVLYNPARGKVTGMVAEIYPGKPVQLKATANKGYVFAGWYWLKDNKPVEDYGDYRNPSMKIPSVTADMALYADFIEISKDHCGAITIGDEKREVPEGKISVDSRSLPTITVSALPKGLTYDKTTGELKFDPLKMVKGSYSFVISVKNAAGYKNDRLVSFCYLQDEPSYPVYNEKPYNVGIGVDEVITNFEAVTEWDTMTFTGLPTGLKAVKYINEKGLPYYRLEGTPTKAGRFTAKLAKVQYYYDEKGRKAQLKTSETYYVDVDGTQSQYVDVSADDLPDGCKVSGAGVYAAGSKITLKATAGKGYVFAGWYTDKAFENPVISDVDYRNPSLVLTELPAAGTVFYPRFIEIKYDYCGEILWPEFNDDGVPEGEIFVESESLPTITVSGLPSGLTFDKKTNSLVVDKKRLKDGYYAIVISVKNAGGYKNDCLVTFEYGEPSEDIPYDYLDEYSVGVTVSEEIMAFTALSEKDSLSFGTLPTGLKLVKYLDDYGYPCYYIEGTPTKAGRFTATWKEVHYSEDENGKLVKDDESSVDQKYYIYVDGTKSMYVDISTNGVPSGCKVTGAGVYAAGSKVTLKATAAKNNVFAGWYLDEAHESPAVGCDDYRNASLVITDFAVLDEICQTNRYCAYYPLFVDKIDDDVGSIRIIDEYEDEIAEGAPWNVLIDDDGAHAVSTNGLGWSQSIFVDVGDSKSAPKLTIKGSISGITVKNYGTRAELYYDPTGKTMPKPGEYTLTFTAVNQSKDSVSRTLVVRVPNLVAMADSQPLMNNLRYGVEEAGADQCQFVLTVGEAIKDVYPDEIDVDSLKTDEEILSANGIEITKVDVTGLPAGITCKNGEFDGKPTKAGVYVMTFTVSYTYIDDPSKTYKSTATAFFRVNDIDATAVGTFNGGVFDAETTDALGTISATISAKGELTSCKIINLEGKSTTIKLQTQSLLDKKEFYSIEGEDADGNDYCFKLYPAGEAEGPTNQLGGVLCAELSGDKVAFASQNVWSDKYYKTLGWLPDVNGEEKKLEEEGLTLKFKSAGAVTAIREGESSSARFELVTCEVADEDVAVGWTGVMTVNIPDWDEGYCESFKVTIVTEDGEDIISDVSKIQ